MAVHHRIVAERVSGYCVGRLRSVLRLVFYMTIMGVLGACVTQSPTVPVSEPEVPIPESPPEKEDGWNAITG